MKEWQAELSGYASPGLVHPVKSWVSRYGNQAGKSYRREAYTTTAAWGADSEHRCSAQRGRYKECFCLPQKSAGISAILANWSILNLYPEAKIKTKTKPQFLGQSSNIHVIAALLLIQPAIF